MAYESSFSERLTFIDELSNSSPEKALNEINELAKELNELDTNDQIHFYHVESEIYLELGEYQSSKKAAERGLTLARDINSPSTLTSELFYNLGYANESLGDLLLAERHYLEGFEIAKSLEQQEQIAKGLINLGAIYYQTNKEELSIVVLQDALKISFQIKDDELSGSIYSELGILYGQLGQSEQAIGFYEKSYQHFLNIKSYSSAYNNMRNLGVNYANVGNYDKSIESYQTIVDNQDKIKNPEIILSAYLGLGLGYAKKEGDEADEQAFQYLEQASDYIAGVENRYLNLSYLIDRAWVLDAIKRYDEALDSLNEAEKMLETGAFSRNIMSALRTKSLQALIHYDLGLFQEAYELLEQYSELQTIYRNTKQDEKVAELRLSFDSDQADLENQLLENKARIESIELSEANRVAKDKENYIAALAIVTLIFGWILQRIYRGQKKLVRATRTDVLTGLANRRYLIEKGNSFIVQSKVHNEPFTVLTIDCDNFKKINDQYGHNVGDSALVLLARVGVNLVKTPNIYGRLGGEEFMVLMPNTNLEQGIALAEELRQKVHQQVWQMQENMLSVSIGVACYNEFEHKSFSDVMKSADNMLYQAKHKGRNVVCG